MEDNKVYLKKSLGALYIIPYHNPWQIMRDSLEEFSDDYMDDRQQP